MEKKTETRKCLYSGEEFIPKRNNQVFANSKNKADYHNEKANALREKRAVIDKKININHKLLLKLLKNDNSIEIDEKILEGKGFFFNVFNHIVNYEGRYANGIYEFLFFKEKNSTKITIVKDDRF
jgi:hypothetical protein